MGDLSDGTVEQSGDVLERVFDACLDRFSGRVRRTLGQRRKLLGLLGEPCELVPRMFGRKFNNRGRRFYARQLLEEVEGGLRILLSIFEQLWLFQMEQNGAIGERALFSKTASDETINTNECVNADMFQTRQGV
jgi:hypothetical protein